MLFTGWNNLSKCHPPHFFSGKDSFQHQQAVLPPQQSQCGNSAWLHLWGNLTTSIPSFKQCDTMYFIIKRPLNSSPLLGECYWNTNSLKWHIYMHHYVFKKNCPLHICLLYTNLFPKWKKVELSPWTLFYVTEFSCLLDSWRSITKCSRNLWTRNHILF